MDSFLVIGDMHLRFGFEQPIGRTSNFQNEINNKIEQIIQICKDRNISNVLTAGDIFDIKTPTKYGFTSIRENKRILKMFKDAGIRMITISGNHDLPFSSKDMKEKSIYHFFADDGFLYDVSNNTLPEDISIKTAEIGKISVTGLDYRNPEKKIFDDLEILNEKLLKFKKDGMTNVVMLHQHFVPPLDNLDFVDFFKYFELQKYSNIDVFVLGHLHKGYKTEYLEDDNGHKQYYCNGWSLTRLAREYYSVNDLHKPQVIAVDISNNKIKFEDIYLNVASFNDTFVKKDIENEKTINVEISKFVSSLKDFTGEVEDIDISKLEFSENIKSRINEYLDS